MESIDHDFQQTEPLGSCGKRCYTYRQAREIINYAPKKARHGHYKSIPKREYWCPVCKAYHVTHFKNEDYNSYDRRSE
jgi:hypothetical protein